MECPNCKLINPDTAQRCDCGYDFESKKVERSYFSKKQNQTGIGGWLLFLVIKLWGSLIYGIFSAGQTLDSTATASTVFVGMSSLGYAAVAGIAAYRMTVTKDPKAVFWAKLFLIISAVLNAVVFLGDIADHGMDAAKSGAYFAGCVLFILYLKYSLRVKRTY